MHDLVNLLLSLKINVYPGVRLPDVSPTRLRSVIKNICNMMRQLICVVLSEPYTSCRPVNLPDPSNCKLLIVLQV